jgi:hypothetical protein
MRSYGRVTWLAILSLVLASGCTSAELRKDSISQLSTVHDLQQQQVLDNLAMFVCNRNSYPYFSTIGAGSCTVTDMGSLGITNSLGRNTAGLFLYNSLGLNPTVSRSVGENWQLNPINDAVRLTLMRCVYQKAVACCFNEPESASCPNCNALYDAFYGNLGGPVVTFIYPTPAGIDYQTHVVTAPVTVNAGDQIIIWGKHLQGAKVLIGGVPAFGPTKGDTGTSNTSSTTVTSGTPGDSKAPSTTSMPATAGISGALTISGSVAINGSVTTGGGDGTGGHGGTRGGGGTPPSNDDSQIAVQIPSTVGGKWFWLVGNVKPYRGADLVVLAGGGSSSYQGVFQLGNGFPQRPVITGVSVINASGGTISPTRVTDLTDRIVISGERLRGAVVTIGGVPAQTLPTAPNDDTQVVVMPPPNPTTQPAPQPQPGQQPGYRTAALVLTAAVGPADILWLPWDIARASPGAASEGGSQPTMTAHATGMITPQCATFCPCWFCWGQKCHVPKDCPCRFTGHYCDTYVWIPPEHVNELTQLTILIQDIAYYAFSTTPVGGGGAEPTGPTGAFGRAIAPQPPNYVGAATTLYSIVPPPPAPGH